MMHFLEIRVRMEEACLFERSCSGGKAHAGERRNSGGTRLTSISPVLESARRAARDLWPAVWRLFGSYARCRL